MVAIKRSGIKSEEKKTGFESYDGKEPTRNGMYRARIVSCKYKRFRENADGIRNEGLVLSVVLEAQKGDPKKHAEYDGWPTTTNIVFSDKEMMIARESNFYASLGVKDEPTIDIASKKDDDLDRGVKVNKIGGKDPIGMIVNVDLKPDRNPSYDRLVIDGVYKFRDAKNVKFEETADEAEDEDLLEEDEESSEYDVRVEELKSMTLAELRSLAQSSDYGLETKGLKKDGLVEAILEYEFEDASDDESDEEPDDEEEEDEEEEDDEEEEEEEEYDEEARREELDALSRNELRAILKSLDPSITTKKSQSDDDLRDQIIALESEVPF